MRGVNIITSEEIDCRSVLDSDTRMGGDVSEQSASVI